MVERGIGPKSLMERSKGRQELGCCLVVCYVELIHQKSVALVGCPTLPFIDQEGAGVTDGRKRKKTKCGEGPSGEPSLPFSVCLPC